MKEIQALIETKKQEFAKNPLFDYLHDETVGLKQRLSWLPCFVPLGMSFTDILRYEIFQENPQTQVQRILNNHVREDETHYHWLLEDLQKLDLNPTQDFTDSVKFIWGEENKVCRMCNIHIAQIIYQAEPVIILVLLECIEAGGNVVFNNTAPVAERLSEETGQVYRYLGKHHLKREIGHVTGNVEKIVASIELTPEQTVKAVEVVERMFQIHTDYAHELLRYAKNNPVEKVPVTA